MVAVTVDLRRLRPHAPRVLSFVRRSSGGGDETARQCEPSSRARIRHGEDTAVGRGDRRAAPDSSMAAARRIPPWPPPPSLTRIGSAHARSARLPPPAGVSDPATGKRRATVCWEARQATAGDGVLGGEAGDDGRRCVGRRGGRRRMGGEAGPQCVVQGGGEVAPDLFEGGRLPRRVWSARGGRAEDRRDVVPIFSRRFILFSCRDKRSR
jgi:hypothetical protein